MLLEKDQLPTGVTGIFFMGLEKRMLRETTCKR
jgi:hypothetical protein